MPIKITITKEWNVPYTIEWTNRAWRAEWDKFPMDRIRALVARQAAINNLIIEFEKGNKFHRQYFNFGVNYYGGVSILGVPIRVCSQ